MDMSLVLLLTMGFLTSAIAFGASQLVGVAVSRRRNRRSGRLQS
jgi:hypothetical protein